MYIAWTFIVAALAASVFFFQAKKRVQRKAACFALYKVRDDLVCLVAEGKLEEDSRVFKHFYSRANNFLASTPNVGLDDMLERLISLRKDGDFRKRVAMAQKEILAIQELPEMKSDEVRQVVADFYRAVAQVMMAHSSVSRYVFLRAMHDKVLPILDKVAPNFSLEVRAAKFATEGSRAISPTAA